MLKLSKGLSSFCLSRPALRKHKKNNAAAINITDIVITTERTTVVLLLWLSSFPFVSEDGGAEMSAAAGGVSFGKNEAGDKGGERGLGSRGAGAGDGDRLGSGNGGRLGSGDGVRLGVGDPTAGPKPGGSDMSWSKTRPGFLLGILDVEKRYPVLVTCHILESSSSPKTCNRRLFFLKQ